VSAWAAKRPCSRVGCAKLVTNAQPCPEHGRRPWEHDQPSAALRGYGHRWRKLRALVLAEEPTCRYCRHAPSTTVDHVIPKAKAGTDERANLAGACNRCHATKSGREGRDGR